MKKSNLLTVCAFCLLVMAVIALCFFSDRNRQADRLKTEPSDSGMTEAPPAPNSETVSHADASGAAPVEPASMSDALFIGDSRTVGLLEYAGLNDADFFCSTGMSVFRICKDRISVPKIGKVTLAELLSNKKYGKIYLMLGINELGYSFQSVVEAYDQLITFVQTYQPDAVILLQANLHVSGKRSEKDPYINNASINRLNAEISKFADNRQRFYLDANGLFDDENGNLSADKTADDAHLYAKYYIEWGEWICRETTKLVKEG